MKASKAKFVKNEMVWDCDYYSFWNYTDACPTDSYSDDWYTWDQYCDYDYGDGGCDCVNYSCWAYEQGPLDVLGDMTEDWLEEIGEAAADTLGPYAWESEQWNNEHWETAWQEAQEWNEQYWAEPMAEFGEAAANATATYADNLAQWGAGAMEEVENAMGELANMADQYNFVKAEPTMPEATTVLAMAGAGMLVAGAALMCYRKKRVGNDFDDGFDRQ